MFETAGSTSLTIVGKIFVGWGNSMFLKQKGSERERAKPSPAIESFLCFGNR